MYKHGKRMFEEIYEIIDVDEAFDTNFDKGIKISLSEENIKKFIEKHNLYYEHIHDTFIIFDDKEKIKNVKNIIKNKNINFEDIFDILEIDDIIAISYYDFEEDIVKTVEILH
jgi:hypothetical protein